MKLTIFVKEELGNSLYRTISYIYNFIKKEYSLKDFQIIVISKNGKKEYFSYLKNLFENNVVFAEFNDDISFKKMFLLANSEKILYLEESSFLSSSFLNFVLNNELGQNVIIPEYLIYFRGYYYETKMIASDDLDFNISSLLWNNCFGNIFAFNSNILEDIGEIQNDDYVWRFFCEVLASGRVVKVIQDTISFNEKMTIPISEPLVGDTSLHSPAILKKYIKDYKELDIEESFLKKFVILVKNVCLKLFRFILKISFVKKFLRNKIVSKVTSIFLHDNSELFKENWFIEAFNEINLYTPQFYSLFRDSNILKNSVVFNSTYSRDFLEIIKNIGGKVDHLIFCPWLKLGGAEKVVLNLMNSLLSIDPKCSIVLFTLRESDSLLINKLPKQVKFIDIGNKFKYKDDYLQERLIATLIMSLKPRFVYNVGCYEVFEMYRRYGEYLSKESKFIPFFFSSRKLNYNRYESLGISYVDSIFKYCHLIFSDNLNELKFLGNYYGLYPKEKLKVLYQPVEIIRTVKNSHNNKKRLNILWASRLDNEKHPEILIAIAKKCMSLNLPVNFYVYGQPVLSKFNTKEFNKYKNVKYMGGFSNGVTGLDTNNYDLFLYTSEYDGMPNVILEAISVGLPILSSKVGGIPELIEDSKSGLLVDNYEEVNLYVEKIKYILEKPEILYSLSKNAQKILKERHSKEEMKRNLKKYLNI